MRGASTLSQLDHWPNRIGLSKCDRISLMDDRNSSSIVKGLKSEWSLFWESLKGESLREDPFETGKVESLGLDQLHEITKALSEDRKRLNQKLEILNKELELNSLKLESLHLVGGEDEGTLKRIGELNDIGQVLSEQLNRLDEKIRWTRTKEEEIFSPR